VKKNRKDGKRGFTMNQERLEWIISGLNRYVLTKAEGHTVKTALEDFTKNRALTEVQEEKLENLYKEKSKLIPNKKNSPFEENSKKTNPRKARWKPFY
jgi:hypothetical protein